MLSIQHHGGSRILLQLANGLADKGHLVTLVAPADKINPIYPINPQVKIKKISSVGNSSVSYLKFFVEIVFRLGHPDFIIANYFGTLYSCAIGRLFSKANIVYFVQDSEEVFFRRNSIVHFLLRQLVVWTFNIPKIYTVVTTKYGLNKILKFNKKQRPVLINLGLPDKVFYPEPKNSKLIINKKSILYFPRLHEIKGINIFLSALNILQKKENLNFELWLVSKEEKSLEPFIKFDNVKIFNPVCDDDLRRIYSSAYMLVSSSWVEGICLPVLEAMACGLPVVLTDSGGPLDYAVNGTNCLITPPGDSEKLAEAMELLLNDEQLHDKIAKTCAVSVNDFKFSSTVNKIESLLVNLYDNNE
jgi:glycosyltransferase involved in cell wall biosynthesis